MDTDKKLKVITWLLSITLVLTVFNSFGTIQTLRSLNGDIVASGQPATKRPSDYKFGKDYHKSLKSNKPMIVLFYADWCHYCINFMPTYQALYKKFRHKYNFVKINVEDSKYRKVSNSRISYRIFGKSQKRYPYTIAKSWFRRYGQIGKWIKRILQRK